MSWTVTDEGGQRYNFDHVRRRSYKSKPEASPLSYSLITIKFLTLNCDFLNLVMLISSRFICCCVSAQRWTPEQEPKWPSRSSTDLSSLRSSQSERTGSCGFSNTWNMTMWGSGPLWITTVKSTGIWSPFILNNEPRAYKEHISHFSSTNFLVLHFSSHAGDRPVRCVHRRPLTGQILWIVRFVLLFVSFVFSVTLTAIVRY